MSIHLCRVPAAAVIPLGGELRAVYAAAFSRPPWGESAAQCDDFLVRLRDQVGRPGFRCVVARATDDGTVCGFVLGGIASRTAAEPLWTPRLDAVVGPEVVEGCLRDRFELLELAVTPPCQRRGIGGSLLDAVLAGLPCECAWLVTRQDAVAARRLYARRGWLDMAVVQFPGHAEPRVIMASPSRSAGWPDVVTPTRSPARWRRRVGECPGSSG